MKPNIVLTTSFAGSFCVEFLNKDSELIKLFIFSITTGAISLNPLLCSYSSIKFLPSKRFFLNIGIVLKKANKLSSSLTKSSKTLNGTPQVLIAACSFIISLSIIFNMS